MVRRALGPAQSRGYIFLPSQLNGPDTFVYFDGSHDGMKSLDRSRAVK